MLLSIISVAIYVEIIWSIFQVRTECIMGYWFAFLLAVTVGQLLGPSVYLEHRRSIKLDLYTQHVLSITLPASSDKHAKPYTQTLSMLDEQGKRQFFWINMAQQSVLQPDISYQIYYTSHSYKILSVEILDDSKVRKQNLSTGQRLRYYKRKVQDALNQAFQFNQNDLAANKTGILSPNQRRKLGKLSQHQVTETAGTARLQIQNEHFFIVVQEKRFEVTRAQFSGLKTGEPYRIYHVENKILSIEWLASARELYFEP